MSDVGRSVLTKARHDLLAERDAGSQKLLVAARIEHGVRPSLQVVGPHRVDRATAAARGIAITHRNELNTFSTEEIDVALWNDSVTDGLGFLPNIILVECKNWSNPVSSIEVSWFDTKLRNRGLDFGILVATNGITGDASDLTAAHSIVAGALKEKRRLLVITTAELVALAHTDQLALLIKRKLCDLAVKGSLG